MLSWLDGSAGAITKEQLLDCLFSGIGIVGPARTDLGELPLKTTPSGAPEIPMKPMYIAYNVQDLPNGLITTRS
ncbi:hypothetical protein ACOJBM_01880 [Rhizobium beringeri]